MAEKLKKITIDDITKYRFPGNLQTARMENCWHSMSSVRM